jgi:hypothetical protein
MFIMFNFFTETRNISYHCIIAFGEYSYRIFLYIINPLKVTFSGSLEWPLYTGLTVYVSTNMCDQLWLVDDDFTLTGINLTFKVAIGTDFIDRQVGVNLTTKHLHLPLAMVISVL